MAQGIPSWMNAEFTQGVLRRNEQDDTIEVIDIHSKPATNKGDNYTSDMHRIYVEIARKKGDKRITEKISLILKVAPTGEGSRKDLIEKSNIFDVEMNMMTNTLKKMNELTGKKHRLNATVYCVRREAPSSLILEDLAPLGFRMADRQSGLDLDHCILVMRNIARFHASSAVVCQRDPSQKELYKKGMFSDAYPDELRLFFNSGTRQLAEEVETWPELGPKYATKIKALSETLYTKGIKSVKIRDDEFNVINHGDAWVNNMLFKYDSNGKPVDHIFVDFQMAIFATPAIDLHYFLATSPQPKVFDQNRQLLLEEYLRSLTSSLKEYGYKGDVPSMAELQRHLKEREFYAVTASFTVLPMVLADKEEVVDLDEMIQPDGTYNNPCYKCDAYRRLMAKRIPYFDERGLLDD